MDSLTAVFWVLKYNLHLNTAFPPVTFVPLRSPSWSLEGPALNSLPTELRMTYSTGRPEVPYGTVPVQVGYCKASTVSYYVRLFE